MTAHETLLETLLAKPLDEVSAMSDKELEDYFSSVLVICRPSKETKEKKSGGSSKKSTDALGEFTEQQKMLLEEILKKTNLKL